MRAQRMLFAQPYSGASLAPIYAALAALLVLSLMGLASAFWPATGEDPVAAREADAKEQPAGGALDGRGQARQELVLPKSRLKSM